MYEQVSHSVLNHVLDELDPNIKKQELRYFYSRLGANFYAIYSLFEKLYGARPDFDAQIQALVQTLAKSYVKRPESMRKKDRIREADHQWFLHQRWVGMALYANGFSDNLDDLNSKVRYFKELGVNLVHILPILKCPEGKSDGGYAVSDFRLVDPRLGTNDALANIIQSLHAQDSLIALDIVVNHTSEEHEWAVKAKSGDVKYQDYYYTFDNRSIPDMFEQTMPDVFPETDPGNFTWDTSMEKWVMTVFHRYQWDLNYSNPEVFIEMVDIILYWANQGVDILRLDAVAFLWKKIGTTSQNEEEAHLILQLFKDCCQVVAPCLLFIAEAIVAPSEIVKYFGEDAVVAKECEIAYNATFMALLWDSVATKNSKLLYQGLKSIPNKLDGATWLNYLRCHDDIGFGFENSDIAEVGYHPNSHRQFLIDYFTGEFPGSSALGMPFGQNDKTGDARISGSLASLVGLEKALKANDPKIISKACNHIVMLHSLILSYGGIPLIYYGDEVATLNDYRYLQDKQKEADSRWVHRPKLNWNTLEERIHQDTIQGRIFGALQKLIQIRKQTDAFADFNNRILLELHNEHLFGFIRYDFYAPAEKIIVVANLSDQPQSVSIDELGVPSNTRDYPLIDLWTKESPTIISKQLVFAPFQFYWLSFGPSKQF